jgi:predicted peptidase
MDFCTNPSVLQLIYLFKIVIRIMVILLPIIILIKSAMDTYKAVVSDKPQDEIKDNFKKLARRIAAALIIFFIPTIVSYAASEFLSEDDISACFTNANLEKIEELKEQKEEERLEQVEQEKEELDQAVQESYQEQQEAIQEKEEQEQQQQQQQQNQNSGSGTYTPGTESLPVSPAEGMNAKTFNGSKSINYWELVPPNVSSSPALIVFLHGSGECGSMNSMTGVSFPKFMKEGYMSGYDAIFLAPNSAGCSWTSDSTVVKELIDDTVAKYNVNKNKIIITGHSLGGNGAYHMVAKYPGFFSAAVPVSGCPYDSASAYTSTPIRSYIGSQEGGYRSCNVNKVSEINNAGGSVEFIEVPNASHSSVVNIYKDSEVINWMLKQ